MPLCRLRQRDSPERDWPYEGVDTLDARTRDPAEAGCTLCAPTVCSQLSLWLWLCAVCTLVAGRARCVHVRHEANALAHCYVFYVACSVPYTRSAHRYRRRQSTLYNIKSRQSGEFQFVNLNM